MKRAIPEAPYDAGYPESADALTRSAFEERLSAGERLEAVVEGVAGVRIEAQVPFVCAAIHDGHDMRRSLRAQCLLTEDERRYEEDPFTGAIIRAMPATIVALDSRYEYDLNRPRSQCVYSEAWGRQVWEGRLRPGEIARSREKHQRFYRIFDALVRSVEKRFGACLVLDVHSYNHRRVGETAPTFNLGTSQIDLHRWEAVVQRMESRLAGVALPNVEVRVARDEVFKGRGHLAAHVSAEFHDTLVIPLEIAKVFMNEDSGEHFPMLLEELRLQLKHVFTDTASFFARRHARRSARKIRMLPSTIDPTVREVDRQLFRLARGVDTLLYVNPINIAAEKKRFIARRGESPPGFRYRHLDIDPYRFREALYRLPVRRIRDPDIQALYRDLVDRLAMRIDLIATIGTGEFLYNSLRYYGEPTGTDMANARFLLHAPEVHVSGDEPDVTPQEAREFFRKRAREWGMKVRVELSGRIVAKAMVDSRRRTLLVNRGVRFSRVDLEALSHHELGVHLVTTLNARSQPLKLFSLGLPGNTEAQEGLAVLCEYLSGNLTHRRLHTLAHRVIAAYEMTRRSDFRHTYSVLRSDHGLTRDRAFEVCLRVYRGGGYTKDYLYLRGLGRALEAYRGGRIAPLLVGKVGFAQADRILEMQQRGILAPVALQAPAIASPAPSNPTIDYLLEGIR